MLPAASGGSPRTGRTVSSTRKARNNRSSCMSTHVELSFIKNFEAEVHVQYQQMGAKLRNTVRTKASVVGSTTTFQKVGKGTANTKARHGKVPVMNVDHDSVECVLQDYYAGDWVDKL